MQSVMVQVLTNPSGHFIGRGVILLSQGEILKEFRELRSGSETGDYGCNRIGMQRVTLFPKIIGR